MSLNGNDGFCTIKTSITEVPDVPNNIPETNEMEAKTAEVIEFMNALKEQQSHYATNSRNSFKCYLCNYECASESHFQAHPCTQTQTHVATYTEERPVKLNPSNCASSSKNNVKSQMHLKYHSHIPNYEKEFECNLCDYKSKVRMDVKRHMITHKDEKPYKCSECNYKCLLKENLICHQIVHSDDRPYKCEVCNYRYIRMQDLTCHMLQHK